MIIICNQYWEFFKGGSTHCYLLPLTPSFAFNWPRNLLLDKNPPLAKGPLYSRPQRSALLPSVVFQDAFSLDSTGECFLQFAWVPTNSISFSSSFQALGRWFPLPSSLSKPDPNDCIQSFIQITHSKKDVYGFLLITVFPRVNPGSSYGSKITLLTPILQFTKTLK